MKRFTDNLFAVVLMGAGLCLGCGEKAPPADAPKADEPAAETGADVDVMGSEIEKALANLSPEDRALAVKQKVCPVTKEPLGSMGEPIAIRKDGKTLFICCEGCKEKAEEKFTEYVAEFGGAPAEKAEAADEPAAEAAEEAETEAAAEPAAAN